MEWRSRVKLLRTDHVLSSAILSPGFRKNVLASSLNSAVGLVDAKTCLHGAWWLALVMELRRNFSLIICAPPGLPCSHFIYLFGAAVGEMIAIMQEYGQTVCVTGSCLSMANANLFCKGDTAIAILPVLPLVCGNEKACQSVDQSSTKNPVFHLPSSSSSSESESSNTGIFSSQRRRSAKRNKVCQHAPKLIVYDGLSTIKPWKPACYIRENWKYRFGLTESKFRCDSRNSGGTAL